MKWYENWIEVFKIGMHTDSAGNTREWTDEDLDAIVENYAEKQDEAPIVLGHPKTDDPAYGWVSELKHEGGTLFAKLERVCPEFINWVEKGLYRKISIALDSDFGLRHIGFLGAVAPAVKGLCNSFADLEDNILFYALPEQGKLFTQKVTPNGVPCGANNKEKNMFKKPTTQEFAEKIEELERELESAQKATQKSGFDELLASLQASAKITAEDRICLEKVFDALAERFAFSEGENLEVQAFTEFLEALPQRCEFKELATRENAPKGTYRTPQEELGMKIARSIG